MTEKEIKNYVQTVVNHLMQIVRYSNYFLAEIKAFAVELEEEMRKLYLTEERTVTKKQKKRLEADVIELLADFRKKVDEFIAEETVKVAENENEFLNKMIAAALGISFIIPATVVSTLSLVPMASAGTPEQFGIYVSDKLGKIYNSILNQSYTFGQDYKDILPQYESQFNAFNRGLESDAETMGYSLPNEYDRIIYTKNDKVISGYVWISMFDTNTCLECGMLGGTRYEKIEDVPYFPRHNRDRCTICPVTDEIAEHIPKSYSEWFEQQSDKDKYKILGKTRFQLYEQGMKFKQFVNNGKKTPLKDLKIPPAIINQKE